MPCLETKGKYEKEEHDETEKLSEVLPNHRKNGCVVAYHVTKKQIILPGQDIGPSLFILSRRNV